MEAAGAAPSAAEADIQTMTRGDLRLSFFRGAFADARRAAQQRARYLFCYVHAPAHPDTEPFVQNVLADDAVAAELQQHFVLWVASASEAAGFAFSTALGATAYPFVAIYVKTSLAATLQGAPGSAAAFRTFLQKAMTTGEPLRAQEVTWQHDRQQREQMRAAHERELAEATRIDTERALEARRAEQAAAAARHEEEQRAAAARAASEAAERAAERAAAEREARAAEAERARAAAAAALPDEAAAIAGLAPSAVARIRVVGFDGSQHERAFPLTAPTRHLYLYAASLPGHEAARPFECVTGFPLAAVEDSDTVTIGDRKALFPRAVVKLRDRVA